MTIELTVLLLSAFLLLAHVMLAIRYKTRQYGTEWNMGARDGDMPPLNAIAGRLDRARGNFLETYPIAIVALLGVTIADASTPVTQGLAWLWLGARTIYLPLYWAGIPRFRTLVWGAATLSLMGIIAILLLG